MLKTLLRGSKMELSAAQWLKNKWNISETLFLNIEKRADSFPKYSTYINMKSSMKLVSMTVIVHNFFDKNVL